jgi:hypothetical protein
MKKVKLDSSHDSLTVKCADGSTRTTNLNENITFGKKLSERMKIPFNPLMEMDTGTYLPSDGKSILNGGMFKQQLPRAVFDIEADVTGEKLDMFELQFNNWPKFLNGGLTKGQLSAIMPSTSVDRLFPKTNVHLNLALEAMRRGQKLVFTCQETDHDFEAQLASMGYPK